MSSRIFSEFISAMHFVPQALNMSCTVFLSIESTNFSEKTWYSKEWKMALKGRGKRESRKTGREKNTRRAWQKNTAIRICAITYYRRESSNKTMKRKTVFNICIKALSLPEVVSNSHLSRKVIWHHNINNRWKRITATSLFSIAMGHRSWHGNVMLIVRQCLE